MKIILIGYRGTGKTSVGKKVATRLGLPFYDTDDLLTNRMGATIREIVDLKGWDFFREKEKEVILDLGVLTPGIIALGGGAVLDPDNREVLNKLGPIIWLTARIPTILKRMKGDSRNTDHRPPLSGEDMERETREIMALRYPLYEEMAHWMIDTEGKTIEGVAMEVVNFHHNPPLYLKPLNLEP